MPIPLIHMTEQEIRDQVNGEIPYVIGDGMRSNQKRVMAIKRLMIKHRHAIDPEKKWAWASLERERW